MPAHIKPLVVTALRGAPQGKKPANTLCAKTLRDPRARRSVALSSVLSIMYCGRAACRRKWSSLATSCAQRADSRGAMPYLKAEAPSDVAKVLREAEAQADDCWRALQIRYYPTNVAIWAQLTGGIRAVEREQAARGSNTPHFDMMLSN